MKLFHAIYENGVFRPTEPVDLPENTTVEVQPLEHGLPYQGRQLPSDPLPAALKNHPLRGIYEVLSERYESDETDVAERHNEHQP
jgi:hypothetical protein